VACGTNGSVTPTVENQPADVISASPLAQSNGERIDWLRDAAIPFELLAPKDVDDFADLESLRQIVGDARIVGLGEATHGTSEFFTLKHRMLRFLVLEMGFDALAMERKPFTAWAQEVIDLIEWTRLYNAESTSAASLRLESFDVQDPELYKEIVLEYYESFDREFLTFVRSAFACPVGSGYETLSPELQDACRTQMETVRDRLIEREAAYVQQSSPAEHRKALRNAVTLLQAEEFWRVREDNCLAGSVRDERMADNVESLLDEAGPDAKIVLWSHDNHIGDLANECDDIDVPSMGHHLRSRFGQDYVAIGFSFFEGEFSAIPWDLETGTPNEPYIPDAQTAGPAVPNSFEWFAHQTGAPEFILNLRDIDKQDAIGRWINEALLRRWVGCCYDATASSRYFREAVLSDEFDALIFVDRSSPADMR